MFPGSTFPFSWQNSARNPLGQNASGIFSGGPGVTSAPGSGSSKITASGSGKKLPDFSKLGLAKPGEVNRLEVVIRGNEDDLDEGIDDAQRLFARIKIARALEERERKELDFAIVYADKFDHGTPGHLTYKLVAKLVEMLEDAYAGE